MATRTTPDRGIVGRERAAGELWNELDRIHSVVRASLESYLDAATGLLAEETELLALLAEAPEQRLRMVDLSIRLRLSKSGVTRLVDRLAPRGLVIRAACPEDRRVIWAALTDEGRAAAAAAVPARAAGLAELLAGGLSADELHGLTATLSRLGPTARPGA